MDVMSNYSAFKTVQSIVSPVYMYNTASKVEHRLNIFREKKTVEFSKYVFVLVIFMKLDKVVIYSKF